MTRVSWRAFLLALREDADVFIFHNPEFIPWALLLRFLGRRVVRDVSESYPDKIVDAKYLPLWARRPVAWGVDVLERMSARVFNACFVADAYVASRLGKQRCVVVANYPVLRSPATNGRGALREVENAKWDRNPTIAYYVGNITRERGLYAMLEAMDRLCGVDIELRLLGTFETDEDREAALQRRNVRYQGMVSADQVLGYLSEAHVGLVLLQPVASYLYAAENTNKLFEYMASQMVVVASDFPGLRRIVLGKRVGVVVDPTSPDAIAKTLRYLHEHRSESRAMAGRGGVAIAEEFNWQSEEVKMLAALENVLGVRGGAVE
jgi:glycosyltransferase involved in cell wall biosynthesis